MSPDRRTNLSESNREPGVVISVNLAEMRKVPMGDLLYDTGIWKLPAKGRVEVKELGLMGDRQGDLNVHGGPLKAVYAYAIEDTAGGRRRASPAAPVRSARTSPPRASTSRRCCSTSACGSARR